MSCLFLSQVGQVRENLFKLLSAANMQWTNLTAHSVHTHSLTQLHNMAGTNAVVMKFVAIDTGDFMKP